MQATNTDWKSARWILPWVAILAAGFMLRVWQLRDQLLADDEWHAVHKLIESDFTGIFTSFGYSDHSIPLTLYYKVLTLTTGLSEWSMHVPLLLAGLLTLLIVPWLLRETIRPSEQLTLACLMAFSPLLIYFSRTARPYALSALLAFVAVIAFYHWWKRPGFKWSSIYVATTVSSAWLHPVTLALTLTPFVFFGVDAIWQTVNAGKVQKLIRVSLIGIATLAALAVLLAAPVINDYSLFVSKSGVHSVSPKSLWATLSLFVGSANIYVVITWSLLGVLGFNELKKRQTDLSWYFVLAILLSCAIIIATSAIMLHHPLVLARYTLSGLFILLLLVAMGINRLIQALSGMKQVLAITAALLVYYLASPLPEQYHQTLNQFMGHMVYHADYDKQRNRYAQHFRLNDADVPAFYRQLAELPPDSVTLLVAPWYLEWHRNAWHLYQQVHRQRILAGFISGLCVENTYGEYPPGQAGIEFSNVIHLTEVAKHETVDADYLVYEKAMAFQQPARARPELDLMACEQQIRDQFGPPMIDDGKMLVYKLR